MVIMVSETDFSRLIILVGNRQTIASGGSDLTWHRTVIFNRNDVCLAWRATALRLGVVLLRERNRNQNTRHDDRGHR
jgi:hypothetical protein